MRHERIRAPCDSSVRQSGRSAWANAAVKCERGVLELSRRQQGR
jgi:hypothetical protein